MKTKRVLFMFQPLDYKAMAEYFEQMAAKGWMLKKMGSFLLTFEKCEPAALKFTVDIFPNISIFEGQGKEEALHYREFCEQSGWRFVTSFTKFQVFCAPAGENLIPIQTDAEVEQKLLKKSFWGSELLIALLALFYLLLRWKDYVEFPYQMLFSNFQLAAYLSLPIVIIMLLLIPADFCLSLMRAKYRIRRHKPMKYRNLKQARRTAVFVWGMVGILMACMAAGAVSEGRTGLFLIACLPVAIGMAGGVAYRAHVEKSSSSKGGNIAKLAVMLTAVVVLTSVLMAVLAGGSIMGGREQEDSGKEAQAVLNLEQLGGSPKGIIQKIGSSLPVPGQYEVYDWEVDPVFHIRVNQTAAVCLADYLFARYAKDTDEISEVRPVSLGLWDGYQDLYWTNEMTGVHWLLLLKGNTVIRIRTYGDLTEAALAVKETADKFADTY